ncbi:hypothetical protein [Pseudoduganella flava]|uniref:Uncharacterized protein n=1 Tax=Pseudoduganella flava TaxID=871742 RepID=A0ABX6FPC2_9BURK|nr:hypothetical protein [Pseudoduganella flava]QGZ38377.1 hypothetical protein GO485_04460 [Pseudoduganella flava]
MKRAIGAALTSALLFPGLGQLIVLKRPARSCLFLLPAAVALFFLVGSAISTATVVANEIAAGTLQLDIQLILQRIAAANPGPAGSTASGVLIAAWLGSILDALFRR